MGASPACALARARRFVFRVPDPLALGASHCWADDRPYPENRKWSWKSDTKRSERDDTA
jgi:hypothetical protein